MNNNDKQALIVGNATIPYRIVIDGDVENALTEYDIINTTYEDFRYVDTNSICIGQFVARTFSGDIKVGGERLLIEDKDIEVQMGVQVSDSITWYSLGNFLITKPEDNNVKDKISFKAMDYTKKFNKEFDPTLVSFPCTAGELANNVCEQCGVILGSLTFTNSDFVIQNNQYTEKESCRKIMQDIGKLAYSWVRIGWDNKCYIDFEVKKEVDEYNKITNDNYYDLTTQQKVFGPVNRVIVGLSEDVEGENIYVEDSDSIATYGVTELKIYDNYLTYTPELRQSVIESAKKLFGLTYTPVEMNTTGHPWLIGNELIEITDMENNLLYTYPFDRTIEYAGHIKTKLVSKADTKTEVEYKNDGSLENEIRKTRIIVDKQNQKIDLISSNVDENNEKVAQLGVTVDKVSTTVGNVETTVENITTTTQTSKGGNHLYLEDAMESNALKYIVEGKSEQNGTPTPDAPIEIETVKGIRNLFKVRDDAFGTQLVTYTKLTDNSIRISATRDTATTWTGYVEVPINLEDIKPNTTYTFSKKHKIEGTTFNRAGAIRTKINGIYNTLYDRDSITFTTPEDLQSLSLVFYIAYTDSTIGTGSIDFEDIMLEEGSVRHSFVPYGSWLKVKVTNEEQEQSTLIDMNKPNLFDVQEYVSKNSNYYTIDENENVTCTAIDNRSGAFTFYMELPLGTYTLSTTNKCNLRVYENDDNTFPDTPVSFQVNNSDYITFTTTKKYITIKTFNTTANLPSVIGKIKLYEGVGNDDYYELASMEVSSTNIKRDTLTIQNNQTTINQRIGKIVLNGSEAWFKSGNTTETMLVGALDITNIIKTKFAIGLSNYFIYRTETFDIGKFYFYNYNTDGTLKNLAISFDITEVPDLATLKARLSENPVTIYYILDEPQTIELGDFPIMLYNNINNVTLMSDLETTTQITYLRNTPLSNDYATNQRVDKTDSDLEQTNNSLNQTKQDVENTALDLHNNYYDKEQIDSIITTTEEEITTLKQTVETNTSSTNLQISVIEEQLKNGVTAVKTETGYTFDKNGLNISKTGSEMSSTLDNDGLSVKRDNTEVLTVRSAGVETENLKVRTYFTIGSHTRVEDYGNGTGFFHIGGV